MTIKSVTGRMRLCCVRRSRIHGKGLFARTRIRKAEHIGTMEGRRVYEDGRYVLWVIEEDGVTYGIEVESDLKYANHSSTPNAELDGEDVFALRDIEAGEEITYHYGEEWDDVA
jgi:hypothetical protein